jgi:hypothetical protein
LSAPEARFTINVKDGIVELEGKESFVDKHLEKFEEIFKTAIHEAMTQRLSQKIAQSELQTSPKAALEEKTVTSSNAAGGNGKHSVRSSTISLPPIPVDLKSNGTKVGLREFYAEKAPGNHYEKTAVFVYYLTKFNGQTEIKYGEILSCYEEVDEKKPSIVDIIKNSIRYKGWLEQGTEKYSTRLTISGENFVKFDLPSKPAVKGSGLGLGQKQEGNITTEQATLV